MPAKQQNATPDPLQALLWCVALPGFGQFLNKQYLKGFVLIVLEVIINMGSKLNLAIIASFHGDITKALGQTNFQWLMFYPCVYMFGIWDAYRNAGGGDAPYSTLPFVFSAFFATVGVIYAPTLRIMGILLGPVWLPMLFCFIGIGFGAILMRIGRIKRMTG
ncbi:hypothetical protein [Brevibacillus dissolubilis]|uniref:hypothetical protein n=1 Tax=Brevibacillus dissolubilis TaxID=1844116 RepID=UPI0021003699|nr:hypothetical protein [Brevibacillus dissolubilis]